MENNMFYKANPLIFKKAEELRSRPTPSEELVWNYIGQAQLGIKFRRQHPASMYVLDFYTHKIKLALEIDGSIHSIEEVKQNDEKRQSHLESLGIFFLRFSNEQVLTKFELVLEKIQHKILTLSNYTSEVETQSPFRAGAKRI